MPLYFCKTLGILYYLYISGHFKKRHTRYHETLQKCKAPLRDVHITKTRLFKYIENFTTKN